MKGGRERTESGTSSTTSKTYEISTSTKEGGFQMHRESYHPGRLTCRVLGNQRGMALVLVMLITMALMALGVSSHIMSANRHGRVVVVKKAVAGVARADAGVEEGRYRLNNAIVGYLTEATPTTGWGYYIKPPSGTAVTFGSEVAEAVDPAFQAGYTQVASVQNHSDFYWVKIRHKTESDAIPGEYTDRDSYVEVEWKTPGGTTYNPPALLKTIVAD